MIVGGPNARKDYHYNETEELFQIKGNISLKTQQNGKLVEYKINEGRCFCFLQKFHIHLIRTDGSVGLVIERKRENIIKMVCYGFQNQLIIYFMKNTFI